MADPTQHGADPNAQEDSAPKTPAVPKVSAPLAPPKEEVSAADLLSLWGGGASSPPSPQKKTQEPTPLAPLSGVVEPPKPAVKPMPAQPPPKPVSEPPKPAVEPPKPAPVPAQKPQETAFWEIPPAKSIPAAPEPAVPHAPKIQKTIKPEPPPPPQKITIEPEIFPQEEEIPLAKEQEKAPLEIVEGEVVKSEPLPKIEQAPILEEEKEEEKEEENFGSQIDEFLAELNLSRKHIFYGIGCLVLIITLIFSGILGYKFYKNRKQAQPSQPIKEQEIQPVVLGTSTGIAATEKLGATFDSSVVGDTGVSSTSAIGTELSGATEIANYIMTFKRLQNAYETDINELLNQATDRRGRLMSHLTLLGKLYADGSLVNANLQLQMDQIKTQYEEKKKLQQTHDVNFFEQLKSFNPQTTENILSDFINVSQEIVSLRARFKALQKIRSYYEFALPRLNARIKDIELNAEALILGLKVYDVKGSDLKLIIPIESGISGADKNESLESSSGFLFINPASVDTGHDYITKPGGGF